MSRQHGKVEAGCKQYKKYGNEQYGQAGLEITQALNIRQVLSLQGGAGDQHRQQASLGAEAVGQDKQAPGACQC